jgi:IAA-amino acid hydrolase
VVSVTFIKGGETFNVIPESMTLGGTFRSMTTQGLSYLRKRIQEVMHNMIMRSTTPMKFQQRLMLWFYFM